VFVLAKAVRRLLAVNPSLTPRQVEAKLLAEYPEIVVNFGSLKLAVTRERKAMAAEKDVRGDTLQEVIDYLQAHIDFLDQRMNRTDNATIQVEASQRILDTFGHVCHFRSLLKGD